MVETLLIGNEVIVLSRLTESLRSRYMSAIIDQYSEKIAAIYAESNEGYFSNDQKTAGN